MRATSTGSSSLRPPIVADEAAKKARWLVGGAVLVISVAAFFRVPLLPSIGTDLAMNASQLGLITTAFAVGRLLTDIPAGRRADRSHPLRTLGLASAILATGSAAMALAPNGGVVIASAALLGVASALANTTGMTFFTASAPQHRRGSSVAVFSAALLGGQALGPTAGGFIAGAAGWRVALVAAALIGVLLAVAATLVSALAFPAPAPAPAPASGPAPSSADGSVAPSDRPVVRRSTPVGRRQMWLLNLVPFASMYTLGAMPQTLIPIIGGDRFGLSASVIGTALGLGGLCRFLGAIVGGQVADRVSRKASLVPGMALGAVGVGVLALPFGTAGWVVSIVLLSLGSNAISVAAAMLGDRAPTGNVGRHLGPYRFIGDLGLIAGPAVSTLLYVHVGATVAVLSIAALMGTVALSSALALHETRWLDDESHDHQPSRPA